MNDDLQSQIDQNFTDLSAQGENEEERMTRLAEEARQQAASAPIMDAAPRPETIETPEAAPAAPTTPAPEELGNMGQQLLGSLGNAFNAVRGGEGSGGASNPIDSLMGDVRDALDNTFGGDKLTREQINERTQGARAEHEENKNPLKGALDELNAVPAGATVGAAESTISALEILGDVAQSIPGLVNQDWKPKAQDDIFQFGPDSKYEWAKWDLGKDEVGAKTGIGKVTEGFLEAAIIFAGTGGFGGMSAAGTKLAATSGALGKAGVMAQAGAQGAKAGIIGDMILASKGDGNLSNLIRDNAPDWYPTWLQALAVEDDDNPLVAMAKSAGEGAVMGFAVDAVGAYLGGVRAINKYRKANPNATVPELEKVAEAAYAKEIGNIEKAQNGGMTAAENLEAMRKRMEYQPPSRVAYHGTSEAAAQAIAQGGFKGGSEGGNILGRGVYLADDTRYAGGYGDSLLEVDLSNINIRDLDRPVAQLMEESGFKLDAYELTSGRALTPEEVAQMNPEDVGYSFPLGTDMNKVREVLSNSGEFQGVRYDSNFMGNARDVSTETLIFDPSVAKLVQKAEARTYGMYSGYRALLEQAGDLIAIGGDSIQKDNFMRLYEQAVNGVPVSIDDVKLLMPEMFTPGTRAIQEPTIAGLDGALKSLPETGGFSINPVTGEPPVGGVMVAIDGVSLDKLDEDSIAQFISNNYDLLTRDDVYVGGWLSEITGKPVIELSRRVETEGRAVLLGKLFDQEGVFRNADFEYIPTGGTDQLKKTAGLHERSATAKAPLDPMPTDRATANAAALWDGNQTQRIMTDAKFDMIAEGTDDATQRILYQMVEDNSVPLKDLSRIVGKPVEELAVEARRFIQDVTGASGEINFDKIRAGMTATDQYGQKVLGDAELVGVIQMMKDTSKAISEVTRGLIQKSDAGMDIAGDLDRLIARQKALMKIHKETVSFQGRSLYNNQIKLDDIDVDNPLPKPDPERIQRDFDKLTKKLDDISEGVRAGDINSKQEAYRLALQLELADGSAADLVNINRSIVNGTTDAIIGNMYNSLLSGPETHVVNSLSSLFMGAYRPLNLAVGSGFKKNKEAFAAYHGINQTVADAWRLTTDAWKKSWEGKQKVGKSGQTRLAGAEQIRLHQDYAAESGNPFVKMVVGFESLMFDLKNNPLLSWSGPLMEAEDAFASAVSSRFEFNMNMMRKAIDEADADTVDSVFRSLLNTEKRRYFTESGEILDEGLRQVADESTFRHKLEGKAKSFADFVHQNPWIRPFFPFVKTGHNIMVFTAESTPLAPFTKEWQDTMRGSDETAKQILKGRAATGSFIMLSAALMAGQGLITGSGPSDPKAREQWLMNHQPRSIKVGDQWVSYERMEPFSSVIQAAADVTWGIKQGLIDENKGAFLASYMTYAFAQNFTDKSVFSGLDPLSRLLKPGFNPQGVVGVPAEIINNIIPLASARRTMANVMEPHRQWYDNQISRLLDQATMGLGGIGNTQYDWLDGTPVTSGNQGLYNALSPVNVHKRGTDLVRDTLEDLGFKSDVISKTLDAEKLSAKDRSELSRLMGSGALYKELESAIKARGYDKFAKELRKARSRDMAGWVQPGGELGLDREQSVYIEIKEIIMRHRDEALAAIQSGGIPLTGRAEARKERRAKAGRRTAQDLQNFYKN